MANSDSIELVTTVTRGIDDAVSSLHALWTLVENSLDNGADWAACNVVHEMLPLIGGKLDAVVEAMGGSPTGAFDEALRRRGIGMTAAPTSEYAGINEQ